MAERYIGTEELAGATVVTVDYNELTLEKNGRTFKLELEYDQYYNTMGCEDGCCSCAYNYPSAYFRALEV